LDTDLQDFQDRTRIARIEQIKADFSENLFNPLNPPPSAFYQSPNLSSSLFPFFSSSLLLFFPYPLTPV
jgi:hypothetical protein